MVPELRSELSTIRARELQLAGSRERLARAAAHGAHSGSPRQRLGRRLISIGAKLAGDAVLIKHLSIGG